MIFDTHLHLVYRDRLSYPWLAGEPALDRDATYEDYLRVAAQVGIVDTLHMEVDVADEDRQAETAMIAELMQQPGNVLRGAIASCRPEHADFPEYLESLQTTSVVKGLRRVLHVVPDETSESQRFRDNVNRLAGTGLSFDLCLLARQLPIGLALVDHCPEVGFVLDHCGVPDIAAGACGNWSEDIAALAQRDNVTAKISGVMAYGDGRQWTLDHLRPFVEHTIEVFGWDRVIWGSDSPVCTLGGHLETWVAATHALLAGCSREEKVALLRDNARRLWRVDGRSGQR